ncbi:MAG: transcriptional regulator [Thermoproteota archaeon]|nr:transcriptional regulator [Thermoproteota archaeon]
MNYQEDNNNSNVEYPTDDCFSNMAEIFVELASSQRLSIIFTISYQRTKLSSLAKSLNLTIQEVHRNTNRLIDTGLIEKNSEGIFFLTTFGNALLKQLSIFDFLSNNKDYFSDHVLGNIPMKFIQRIGALNGCKSISGIVSIIESWKRLYNESSEFIYGILPQIPLELIQAVIPKIKYEGVKFNYILPQNALVPKMRNDIQKSSGYTELLKQGIIERRMMNKIDVAVVLNEKQATVMFPTLKGEIDMNSMFISNNDIKSNNGLFHEWCIDFFRYCWYHSKSFDERKLIDV